MTLASNVNNDNDIDIDKVDNNDADNDNDEVDNNHDDNEIDAGRTVDKQRTNGEHSTPPQTTTINEPRTTTTKDGKTDERRDERR